MSDAAGPPPPSRPVTRTPSGYTVAELAALTPEDFEARSLRAVEAGQLPLRAQQRLADLRDQGAWSSDLSVSEFDVLGSVDEVVDEVLAVVDDVLEEAGQGVLAGHVSLLVIGGDLG